MKKSFLIVNSPAVAREEKTVVVFGAGRGGTSAVAGCLRELGVVMPNAHPLKHEWSPLQDGVDAYEETRAVISAIDSEHAVWGWKSPKDVFTIMNVAGLVRNLHVVVVVRDILDVCCSVEEKEGVPWDIVFSDAVAAYEAIGRVINYAVFPLAVVSYEGLMSQPSATLEQLVDWLNISPAHQMRQNAIEFLSKGKGYQSIASESRVLTISDEDLATDALYATSTVFQKRLNELLKTTSAIYADSAVASGIISELRANVGVIISEPRFSSTIQIERNQISIMPLTSLIALSEMLVGPQGLGDCKKLASKILSIEAGVYKPLQVGYDSVVGEPSADVKKAKFFREAYFQARISHKLVVVNREKQQLEMDALSNLLEVLKLSSQ